MNKIKYLLENSNLPGPRGNLELLYEFSKNADENEIAACLAYLKPDVKNSPEEFLGMCGILSYSVKNKNRTNDVLSFLKMHASHNSWRIRESVAMAIQEIAEGRLPELLPELRDFFKGNNFEKRAYVAGLCEPKLLKNKKINLKILNGLFEISSQLSHIEKLDDGGKALRKALGYGWSVLIAASPTDGKAYFEDLFNLEGKHIKWIIKENLKKNRLIKLDARWVKECLDRLDK